MKVLNLAFFSLIEYIRSCGLLLEVIMTAVTICLFLDNYTELTANDVYLAVGFFSAAVTTLTTYRLTKRETNAHVYMILMRSLSRMEYLLGKIIAVLIPSALFSFILFLLGFHFTRMSAQYPFNQAVVRLYPILLVIIISESILMLFTPLVMGKMAYIAGLGLMCFLTLGHNPILDILPPIQSLLRVAGAPTFALDTRILLLWGFYTVLFFMMTWFVFMKRELNYDPE